MRTSFFGLILATGIALSGLNQRISIFYIWTAVRFSDEHHFLSFAGSVRKRQSDSLPPSDCAGIRNIAIEPCVAVHAANATCKFALGLGVGR